MTVFLYVCEVPRLLYIKCPYRHVSAQAICHFPLAYLSISISINMFFFLNTDLKWITLLWWSVCGVWLRPSVLHPWSLPVFHHISQRCFADLVSRSFIKFCLIDTIPNPDSCLPICNNSIFMVFITGGIWAKWNWVKTSEIWERLCMSF